VTTATEQHVDPLTAMLYPAYTKRCDHCGGFVVASPEEAMQRVAEAAYEPLKTLAQALQDPSSVYMAGQPAIGTPPQGYGRTHEHHRRHHRHGRDDCGCHERRDHHRHHQGCDCHECRGRHHHHDGCGCHDRHCECRVCDADLVVNARLGERRVVPITIENNRRREREVTLELSDFSSRGGSEAAVKGSIVPPTQFTLDACREHQAVVVIQVGGTEENDNKTSGEGEGEGQRYSDVDDCEVAYADLRIAGCDHRPLRIAVATLPRDCHTYPVDCSCGCC
jgi:hypothetical protein